MDNISLIALSIIPIASEMSITEAIQKLKIEVVRIKLAESKNNVSAVSRELKLDRHSVMAYRDVIYSNKRNSA